MTTHQKVFGYYSTLAIVVANMVGTGVFTTLGFQVVDIKSTFTLIFAWLLGGIIAACGALSYGELAAAMPQSGGEYHFLTRIFHPLLGFVAGWVSVTVGFSAPIALAAMALGRYAATFMPLSPMLTAITAILIVTLFHIYDVRIGRAFQVVTTLLKLGIIIFFCIVGLSIPPVKELSLLPTTISFEEILTPAFAVSLIYVSYAFSGWNAATYVASEVKHPQRNIPRALLHGVGLVTICYVLLNYVFLRTIPLEELAGKVEVGALSAAYMFGKEGAIVINIMLCLLLISTISAMVLAGPRVLQRIGKDFSALHPLAKSTHRGAPLRAILFQQILACLFVITDSFEGVLSYAGFTLSLFTLLTVMGVFVLRYTAPDLHRPYRVWGYPMTPALFIILSVITLFFVLQARPLAGLAGIVTILGGVALALAHKKPAKY